MGFTKEQLGEVAHQANFAQWFKMLMWKNNYKGEKKMDKMAMEIIDYLVK